MHVWVGMLTQAFIRQLTKLIFAIGVWFWSLDNGLACCLLLIVSDTPRHCAVLVAQAVSGRYNSSSFTIGKDYKRTIDPIIQLGLLSVVLSFILHIVLHSLILPP